MQLIRTFVARHHGLPHRARHEGSSWKSRSGSSSSITARNAEDPAQKVRTDPRVIEAYLGSRLMGLLLEVERIDVFYGRIRRSRRQPPCRRRRDRDADRRQRRRQDDDRCAAISGSRPPAPGTSGSAARTLPLQRRTSSPKALATRRGRRILRAHERCARTSTWAPTSGATARRGRTWSASTRSVPAVAGRQAQLAGTLSGGEQQMLCIGRAHDVATQSAPP